MTDKWLEIFKTGTQTDSAGNVGDWTERDLDLIVANYNGGKHEAPIVIGHPEHNSPAYGWVESLKRDGNLLYAKLKDVMPQFADLVKAGTYKKRSISLYPDLTLRHIGFLGGMPPAVKGLADIAFADGDKTPMTFVTREPGFWEKMKELLKFSEQNQTPQFVPTKKEEESMKPEEVQDLVTTAVTEATKQFSEAMGKAITGLETQIALLKQENAADRQGVQRREFREFLMTPEMQQRVPEGSREATINQMVTLSAATPVEFGEGDKKSSKPALDVYKEQLKTLAPVVSFGEHATKDKAADVTANGLSALALSKKAVEFQEAEAKAGRIVGMSAAVNHIMTGGNK